MGDWTRQEEHSWPTLDALSWPVRRWVCDRLVGQHAYSRNVAPTITPNQWNSSSSGPRVEFLHNGPSGPVHIYRDPFDQECP